MNEPLQIPGLLPHKPAHSRLNIPASPPSSIIAFIPWPLAALAHCHKATLRSPKDPWGLPPLPEACHTLPEAAGMGGSQSQVQGKSVQGWSTTHYAAPPPEGPGGPQPPLYIDSCSPSFILIFTALLEPQIQPGRVDRRDGVELWYHLTDKETEAQRGHVSCAGSPARCQLCWCWAT